MADIAQIGFAADTSELEQSKAALQGLVQPAKAAESSASKLSNTLAKLDAAADKLNAAASGLSGVSDKLAASLQKEAGAANAVAVGLDKATTSKRKAAAAAAGLDRATVAAAAGVQKEANAAAAGAVNMDGFAAALYEAAVAQRALDSQVAVGVNRLGQAITAARGAATATDQYNNSNMVAATGVRNLGIAIERAAQQHSKYTRAMMMSNLNLSRQFMDIGVTAAMGMNPLLIAMQQGPQILDGFQTQAMMTGRSVKQSMLDTANSVFSGFMRWLPTIARVIGAIAALGAAGGLAFRGLTKDIDDNIDHLGLTEKQMERLEDSGVNTAVTLGDAFTGLWVTIKERFFDAFGEQIDWLQEKWSNFLDKTISDASRDFARLGGEIAAVFAWGATMRRTGSLEAANAAGREAYEGGMNAVRQFGTDVQGNIAEARDRRVREAAGRPPKPSKSHGQTDQDRFDRITRGAEADIAAQRARVEALGLTMRAEAEHEMRLKLTNQALERGLTLTPAMTAEINRLAGAYADAYREAERAEFIFNAGENLNRNLTALEAQREAIGLIGRELHYQTKMTELLAEAERNKQDVDRELLTIFDGLASAYADAASDNDVARFYDETRRASQEALDAAMIERETLGMTAEAAARYTFEQNLLNEARRRGIDMTPQQVASLVAMNNEYVAITEEIRAMNEALSFVKDTSRGFFDDMMNGLREGESFWKTFGNAVANVLSKIADKLADLAFDNLFSGGGSGGWFGGLLGSLGGLFSGGKKFALGAAFDGSYIDRFAKGGAFTNSIVSRPTLFQFANGGALGEMGEAGPEAIMPLTRGPDGSLGVKAMTGGAGATGAPVQRVELAITARPTETLYLEMETIAKDTSIEVTKEGLNQYDEVLASRVHEIASDERVR